MSKEVYPPMHTAQHILNQVMVGMFGCERNFSDHIEKKKSKLDYHFDRVLTADEEKEIEKKVNDIISSSLTVAEEYISQDDAEKKYNLKRMADKLDGDVRIIKIGDFDACPCSGPHVQNTKELIGFRLVSSKFEAGVLRLIYKLLKSEISNSKIKKPA